MKKQFSKIYINLDNIKLYDRCLRCGKKLISFHSRRLGYGETCYKKVISEKIKHKDLL